MSQNSSGNGILKHLGTAILITWLVSGTMDALGATVSFLAHGKTHPEVIWKYVASAVFGKKAYDGGATMIAWGLFFHYMIALGLTVFYYIIYPKIKFPGEHPVISGILYAIFAWAITTRVIVPLSLLHAAPFVLIKVLEAVGILIICIGLPISLMANKHYLYKK